LQSRQLASLGSALDNLRHVRTLDASKNELGSAAAVASLHSLLAANLQVQSGLCVCGRAARVVML
jgi:hypothetical protein